MSSLFNYLDVSGPLFEYLGHFTCKEFIEEGHNTDDAEATDKAIESYVADRAPNNPVDKPGGA